MAIQCMIMAGFFILLFIVINFFFLNPKILFTLSCLQVILSIV